MIDRRVRFEYRWLEFGMKVSIVYTVGLDGTTDLRARVFADE